MAIVVGRRRWLTKVGEGKQMEAAFFRMLPTFVVYFA
jgi:hypothetical protein